MNIIKLKIFAMLMRLQEIKDEQILEQLRNERMKPFLPEPIQIKPLLEIPKPLVMYDKNGKLFETPKSKYHK